MAIAKSDVVRVGAHWLHAHDPHRLGFGGAQDGKPDWFGWLAGLFVVIAKQLAMFFATRGARAGVSQLACGPFRRFAITPSDPNSGFIESFDRFRVIGDRVISHGSVLCV